MFSFFRRLHFEYTAKVSVQNGRYYENAVLPCIHHLIGMYIGKLADDACVFQVKMLSNRNIFIVETQVKPGKCLEKLVKGNLRNIDQKLEYIRFVFLTDCPFLHESAKCKI
mgnify:CR=1 FL=1